MFTRAANIPCMWHRWPANQRTVWSWQCAATHIRISAAMCTVRSCLMGYLVDYSSSCAAHSCAQGWLGTPFMHTGRIRDSVPQDGCGCQIASPPSPVQMWWVVYPPLQCVFIAAHQIPVNLKVGTDHVSSVWSNAPAKLSYTFCSQFWFWLLTKCWLVNVLQLSVPQLHQF